ncbi:hypothetical protein V8B55DRAFT_1583730 [Mucor lusitanicus]|uniref:MYND-type domain-containing protein n=2 Tax=Mucor circinelloides f. lusitanicus TaxID=29924 RepID=A0A168J9R1_MUCCL|nr:hypothetical protein FB192DRAFT_1027279 [Mucor lusitanicus]OAD00932.1 hypothetical protein MUCCIDRAFT_112353 [Mucor lusitanicus CBS 277.49]
MEAYLEHHHLVLQDSSDDTIRGRYITSNAHLIKGTEIITSQPLGTVALPQTLNEFCNYCFRKQTSPPLQRCSQCKKAYFCDMACFKNAWLSYHQYVCKANITSRDAEDDMDLEMLERVALNIARYKKRQEQAAAATATTAVPAATPPTTTTHTSDGSEETVDITMQAFFSLVGHDQLQQRHVKEKYTLLASEALKKPFIQQTGLTLDQLVHYLNVFKSNNFAINDTDMFAIGEGTYPIAALFNHSCRPNAVVMFEGALASIHAIEDIEPGTEITIAYVDAAHSRKYRQKSLQDKYFFQCTCERCCAGEKRPYLSLIDTLLGDEESDWDRAQQLLAQHQKTTTMDKSARILQEVEAWDLLEMCKEYDRKSDGCPDPAKPLTMANYTHYFIQFFAPYLLTWNQPELHQQQVGHTLKTSLTDFDDPLPEFARPPVQSTYDEIMKTAIDKMLSYPTQSDTIIPYRLDTLSVCSRLFYDEMAQGHWQNAVKLGMHILIQYCLIYPPYHPMLAQHFLVLAKACWNSIIQSELIGDNVKLEKVYERGVRRWIMSSKETVAVAFGRHGKLWREVLELEWIFLREQKLK